jgi:hypothetical protein
MTKLVIRSATKAKTIVAIGRCAIVYSDMQKWEYMLVNSGTMGIVAVHADGREEALRNLGTSQRGLCMVLNDLGNSGWEAVAMDKNILVFKRPKP